MKQGTKAKVSPEPTELPVIDWNLCIKLANNKTAVAQEILLLVIQQLPSDLEEIKKAEQKADYAEWLRCVHKLHGALCYSGMPRLKNAVAHLENALKQNQLDQVRLTELSGQLENEAKTVLSSPLPC
jgi:two-component system sensor histidine kinase BarA